MTYGASIHFTCDSGYILLGNDTLQCEGEEGWSSDFPECMMVVCPSLNHPRNGQILNGSETMNSSVKYECFLGYDLRGNKERVCLEDSTWSGSTPMCIPVNCSQPQEVANGSFQGELWTYGEQILYQCDLGYILNGQSILTCKESETWDYDPPTCIAIVKCSIPVSPRFGRIDGNRYEKGDTVTYICDSGYKPNGPTTHVCLSNGEWDNKPPLCEQIECRAPIPVENAIITNEKSKYVPGMAINYKCGTGFEILGKDSRSCYIDGTWSGPNPKCKTITCNFPTEIENGSIDKKGSTYGSKSAYSCNRGYVLDGPEIRTCSENKNWTGKEPRCNMKCFPPEPIAFGTIVAEDNNYIQGSKVTYTCQADYELIGINVRVCLKTQKWDGNAPICTKVECDKPSYVISNGRMLGESFTVGSIIRYECDIGYFIDGNTERLCNVDATWDRPIPVCERVKCPRPLRPTNGYVEGFDFRYTEKISYRCKAGYKLVGLLERICLANSTWSGPRIQCVPITCSQPPDMENGNINVEGLFYKHSLTYSCSAAFELKGVTSRHCTGNGTWSGESPECVRSHCDSPPTIENGESSDKAVRVSQAPKYNCQDGFVLMSEEHLICSANGTYIGKNALCLKQTCSEPPPLKYGTLWFDGTEFNEAVAYACRPGFELIGDALRKCGADGLWTGTAPDCVVITCVSPPPIHNGEIEVQDGYDFGSKIIYTCSNGYVLKNGNSKRQCTAFKAWSGDEPVCAKIECPNPEIINGYITVSTGAKSIEQHVRNLDAFVSGIFIEFDCERGFELSGASEIMCHNNGTWYPPVPTCERMKCPDPGIDNAVYTAPLGLVVGVKVVVACVKGFELVGRDELFCNDALKWNEPLPKCEILSCPTPIVHKAIASVVSSPDTGHGYPYGMLIELTCDFGYVLEGPSLITCGGAKSWTPRLPSCTEVFCKIPQVEGQLLLENSLTQYRFGDKLHFSCGNEQRYEIIGRDNLECGSDSTWDGSMPTCQFIECPLPDITDGYFKSSVTLYVTRAVVGTELLFFCKSGYALHGQNALTCQSDKKWSSALPVCIRQCAAISINNGDITYRGDVGGFNIGVRVHVQCEFGYNLIGDAALTCLTNGNWSSSLPSCGIISCNIPQIRNGQIIPIKRENPDEYVYEDEIDIRCDYGFEILGPVNNYCQKGGKWRNEIPICRYITCPEPYFQFGLLEILQNTRKEVSDDIDRRFTYGTTVLLACIPGYEKIGESKTECLASGQWSTEMPSCSPVNCVDLTLENGIVINGNITEYKSVVTFECDLGYSLTGVYQATCESDGAWSEDTPQCILSECPDPAISNAKFEALVNINGTFTFGDTVFYTCSKGFWLNGTNEILCLPDQIWSDALPECVRVMCPVPLLSLRWGAVDIQYPDEKSEFSYETKLSFQCDMGYRLDGDHEISCGSDKKWSGIYPSCQAVLCRHPVLLDGYYVGDGTGPRQQYTFGDILSFRCNEGFFLLGEPEMFCQPDGKWTSAFPICERKTCHKPFAIPYSTIIGNSYKYDDFIQYKCDEGYEIRGQERSTCLANVTWSGLRECTRVRCQLPDDIDNGLFMLKTGSVRYNDVIVYDCDFGYTIVGEAEHICQSNRTWSGATPYCRKVKCPYTPVVSNSRVKKKEYLFGDVYQIDCKVGYALQGEGNITCLGSGLWTKIQCSCDIVRCSIPLFPVNGQIIGTAFHYNSTIRYVCTDGFELVGLDTRRCMESGMWSAEMPVCIRITCSSPGVLDNGYIESTNYMYESTLTYKCNTGYQLEGNAVRYCQGDKTWSGDIPKCQIVICSLPPDILHGHIIAKTTTYQAVINYTCDYGYLLDGTSERSCMADHNWSGEVPTCQPISCGEPVNIANGFLVTTDGLLLGSRVAYSCSDTYELVGESNRLCQGDGSWSGDVPLCKRRQCPLPPIPDHVNIQGDDFTIGSSLSFTCDDGYALTSTQPVICQNNGFWNGEFPRCERKTCGLPKALDNSIVVGTGFNFEGIVEFLCTNGFEMLGDSRIKCLANGLWSKPEGVCAPISCPEPPSVDNSIFTGTEYTFGQFVFYKCNKGYQLRGNNLLECNAEGKWVGNLPRCQMVSCGTPKIIFHATVVVTKTTFGSEATYNCNSGYNLRGSKSVRCVEDGSWIYDAEPECVPVDCGPPPQLPNGGVKVPDVTYGNVAMYFCLEGYAMQGVGVIQCGARALWNSTSPKCIPVSCPIPQPPLNGNVQGDTFKFGNDILYTCDLGYQLVGSAERICQPDGKWSRQKPRCDCKFNFILMSLDMIKHTSSDYTNL